LAPASQDFLEVFSSDKLPWSRGSLDLQPFFKMASHNEKEIAAENGVFERHSDSSGLDSATSHVAFDDKATRRLLRRIDLHLIPLLAFLYL
jgi:hypothetical protein